MTVTAQKRGNEDVGSSDADQQDAKKKKIAEEESPSSTNETSASNELANLKKFSIVVADSGDFNSIQDYTPEDATTNPSLILQASQLPQYQELLTTAITNAKKIVKDQTNVETLIDEIVDQLSVLFGIEILKIVPGVVSTEVPARFSYDTKGSIAKAKKLIDQYEKAGISRDRVLIKMATTWEGCEAAKVLEKEGIHCNMTLLFSFAQAVAAAEAGATLISPFVGRILDWYKKQHPEKIDTYVGKDDPGVQSVTQIYNYYKKYDYKTTVMAASFRNKGEILALAGCDKQTISPKLLEELKNCENEVERILSPEKSKSMEGLEKVEINEQEFRWMLNSDAMATEKLAEGIRNFHNDTMKLRKLVADMLEKN